MEERGDSRARRRKRKRGGGREEMVVENDKMVDGFERIIGIEKE